MKVQLVDTGEVVDCHHSMAKVLKQKGIATNVNAGQTGAATVVPDKTKLTKDEKAELEELRALKAKLAEVSGGDVSVSVETDIEVGEINIDAETSVGDGDDEDKTEKPPAKKKPTAKKASK